MYLQSDCPGPTGPVHAPAHTGMCACHMAVKMGAMRRELCSSCNIVQHWLDPDECHVLYEQKLRINPKLLDCSSLAKANPATAPFAVGQASHVMGQVSHVIGML